MRWLHCLLILFLVSLCSGCLISHKRQKIVRQGETRAAVHFESPEVARQFNELATSDARRQAEQSSASLGVPFLLGLSHTSIPSQNAFYNDQVTKCDTDCNGIITGDEVAAYVSE